MSANTTKTRMIELDYFRFIAAIMVVLFHYTSRGYEFTKLKLAAIEPITKYGYLGVHLFFIISGFVILKSAQNRTVLEFAKARFVRLAPMYFFAGLITLFVVKVFQTPFQTPSTKDVIAHILFLHLTPIGIVIRSAPIDGSYWSLAVEGMFYAIVCGLIASKVIKRLNIFLFCWIASSVILLMCPDGFFFTVVRLVLISKYAALFSAGAFFYLIYSSERERLVNWFGVLVSLFASIFSCLIEAKNLHLQNPEIHNHSAIPIILIICVFFSVFALFSAKLYTLPQKFACPIIGNLTYPLYLLHQNIGYVMILFLAPVVGMSGAVFLITSIMLLAAIFMHYCVEVPLGKVIASKMTRRTKSA